MDRQDAADLLGVSERASKREVRSAFRRRVRADHPDNKGDGTADLARLAKARDRMLEPAVEPASAANAEPYSDSTYSIKVKPARPTTLTYGYEPYTEPERERFQSRTPPGPSGSSKGGTIGSAGRMPKANVAMIFIAAVFAAVIIVSLIRTA